MQRYYRSNVFPFHFSNICQQYIMYVLYSRYKYLLLDKSEKGILIKYMYLNFSKPDISSKQTHIKLNFRQTNCLNLQPT